MGLTAFYGAALEDEDGLKVLEKAYELGVTHFDTAEIYAGKNKAGEDRHNEALVGQFLKKVGRDKVTFATKYFPGTPEKQECSESAVRQALQASLDRLGVDSVDLYYLHRVPSLAAVKSWMSACKKLVEEGKIKYLGLSEATPEEIRAAHAIHPLTAVQQEWSLVVRNLEKDVVPVCRELGIAIVAYSPLARGLTSAMVKKEEDWVKIGNGGGAATGFQSQCPYLQGANLAENIKTLAPLEEQAALLGVSPATLSLTWLHAQGEDVFPIPGTTKITNLENNVAAAQLAVSMSAQTPEHFQGLMEKIGPKNAKNTAGDRYPAAFHMLSFESKM